MKFVSWQYWWWDKNINYWPLTFVFAPRLASYLTSFSIIIFVNIIYLIWFLLIVYVCMVYAIPKINYLPARPPARPPVRPSARPPVRPPARPPARPPLDDLND